MKYSEIEYISIEHPPNSGDFITVVSLASVSTWRPFKLSRRQAKIFPLPYRQISSEDIASFSIVGVRTDVFRYIWCWWWFVYRVENTVKWFKYAIVLSLQEWGLAYVPQAEEISWSHIGKRSPSPKPQLKPQESATPCAKCKYWSLGLNFCAVHPAGRPGQECRDWQEQQR